MSVATMRRPKRGEKRQHWYAAERANSSGALDVLSKMGTMFSKRSAASEANDQERV